MRHADVPPPDLSVIVPSYNAARTIETCLDALAAQRTAARFEVIVVDSGSDATRDIVAAHPGGARLLVAEERRYAGAARNLGIAVARANLLAFTDADCVAAADWVDAIVAAHHHRADPVIGGVIANLQPESLVGRAYYYTEFNRWMPGTAAGYVDDIPGCCWSMKRAAYERYGPFLEGTYCSDTAFHWRMAGDGLRPYLEPGICVDHSSPSSFLACLRHQPEHGRFFARVRVSQQRLSRHRILLHAATAPLLPPLFLLRAARRALRNAAEARRFLPASPLVLLAMAGWAWGEMSGYLDALRAAEPAAP